MAFSSKSIQTRTILNPATKLLLANEVVRRTNQEGCDDGEESTEAEHDAISDALGEQSLAAEVAGLASADAVDDRVVFQPGQVRRTSHRGTHKGSSRHTPLPRRTGESALRSCTGRMRQPLLRLRPLYTAGARISSEPVFQLQPWFGPTGVYF